MSIISGNLSEDERDSDEDEHEDRHDEEGDLQPLVELAAELYTLETLTLKT